jgi:hypothetical protein
MDDTKQKNSVALVRKRNIPTELTLMSKFHQLLKMRSVTQGYYK